MGLEVGVGEGVEVGVGWGGLIRKDMIEVKTMTTIRATITDCSFVKAFLEGMFPGFIYTRT